MLTAYCINLARRTDRRVRMLAIADKAGLALVFIEALDATWPENVHILSAMPATGPTGALGMGALACTQSHARAWQALLESGEDYGLILEDDVILSNDFTSTIKTLIASKPDFDLIKPEDGGSGQGWAGAGASAWRLWHPIIAGLLPTGH